MNKIYNIFGLILLLMCSARLEAAIVRLEPATVSVAINNEFDINVMVDDVTDLMGAEINIVFDPTKLEVGTISQGELLERATYATVAFFPATSTGTVGFAASRLGGNPLGVTGSGTIATIHFKCLVNDSNSLMSIELTDLRDPNLQTIPVTGRSGATITTTHGTATGLTIKPSLETITSGGTISYTAMAHDAAGNTWTVTAAFNSNDPLGTFSGNVYTADKVGTWTITGDYNGLIGTATIVVTHGTATGLTIKPSLDTVTSGGTISYTATAQDAAGNTWTVTAAFSSNDPLGTFSGNEYTAGKVGTWTITGEYNNLSTSTTIVVLSGLPVSHGTATALTIKPSLDTVTSGGTISYTATAQDADSNTWTVTAAFNSNDPLGRFSGNVYTADKVGTWTITGNYNGLIGTATIVVTHGTATGLTIDPIGETIPSGDTISYTAIAQDAADNTWDITAAFSSNDPLGRFSGNVYTAGKVGTWTITGKYNGLFGTATIVVTHGIATALTIKSSGDTVTLGGTVSYTATAQDAADNTWTVTAGFSSNDPLGTFLGNVYTAGMVGTWMITGEYDNLSTSTTIVVLSGLLEDMLITSSQIPDQICHKPFSLTITTVNKQGHLIDYSGTLILFDLTEGITPQIVDVKNGRWTGTVTINKSRLNNKIIFKIDEIEHISNPFNVWIDAGSDESIDDSGVVLKINPNSVDENYYLEINHEPSGYEIDKANHQAGTSSVLLNTLHEIKGTIATSNERLVSFKRPIELSLIYYLKDLGNIDVRTLKICRLQNGQWVPIPGNVYPNNNMVTTLINETGTFILKGVTFGNGPSDVIVYPNPCKGTEVIFRYANDCDIEIYDIAGDLLKRVHVQKAEYTWDTRDDYGRLLDNGVYIYVIIGKDGSKRGKVVIIR